MTYTVISRKEKIILSAIDVIHELGIHGLSTREIAKREGVTDASLYRHFKSKEEIILEVLNYYARFDSVIMNSIENRRLSPREGIVFFIKSLAEYYENYPQITAIVNSYEALQHESEEISKRVQQIFYQRSLYITGLVEKGRKYGEFAAFIDSEDLSDVIIGLTRNIILKWRMSGFEFLLKKRIMSALESILKNTL